MRPHHWKAIAATICVLALIFIFSSIVNLIDKDPKP